MNVKTEQTKKKGRQKNKKKRQKQKEKKKKSKEEGAREEKHKTVVEHVVREQKGIGGKRARKEQRHMRRPRKHVIASTGGKNGGKASRREGKRMEVLGSAATKKLQHRKRRVDSREVKERDEPGEEGREKAGCRTRWKRRGKASSTEEARLRGTAAGSKAEHPSLPSGRGCSVRSGSLPFIDACTSSSSSSSRSERSGTRRLGHGSGGVGAAPASADGSASGGCCAHLSEAGMQHCASLFVHGSSVPMFEDSAHEFKLGGACPAIIVDTTLKYVCAFLNAHGGSIFFGVDDGGGVVGVRRSREEVL
eukprot:TRINITY_DN312_c0_g1_i2.p1 TRINITY_DN312_c0_g1~~TRINITY_DN312_c0_g1_i2.p1  ORF type:complete len:331 (+),score=72.80 TRINITY_DN312_c0_g1_i2:76-993(+)